MNRFLRNPKGNGLFFWLVFALINWTIVYFFKKLITDDFALIGMLTLLSYVGLITFGVAIIYTKKDKKVVAGAALFVAFLLNGIITVLCAILVLVFDEYRLVGLTTMSILITLIDPFAAAMIAYQWRVDHPAAQTEEDVPATQEEKPAQGGARGPHIGVVFLSLWQSMVLQMLGQVIFLLNKILYVTVEIAKKNRLTTIEAELEAKFPSRHADAAEKVKAEEGEKKE